MFEIKDDFYLNDKPIKIISGAIHYFRVVPEYWEDRLLKLKAMGCNTVETYVPWNAHEPEEGQFNFEWILDIRSFIQTAQKVGLMVIVRPSPYICAEWEFGGLPAWLLQYEDMKLRVNHPIFLEKVDNYFQRLFQEFADLQIEQGGPIIMMQVENEYGSFGSDKTYLKKVAQMMRKYGATVPFVTSDGAWSDMLKNGTVLDDAYPTVNCGSKLVESMQEVRNFTKSEGPLMVMEYWIGWFDAWGRDHHTRDFESAAQELDEALEIGHVNFYMFHGGTNFGFWNGSNYYETHSPDTTSYDYDAPLTEWGDISEKYKALQIIIKKHATVEEVALPEPIKKIHYGTYQVTNSTSLFANLENLAVKSEHSYTLPMEKLGQNFGYVLYETDLGEAREIHDFKLLGANDRAQVFVNDKHVLTQYDQELGTEATFPLADEENRLSILVENLGRVNYSSVLNHQHKGINEGVIMNRAFLSDWNHYSLPLDNIDQVDFTKAYQAGLPSFHQFKVEIDEIGDTFIDMTGWGKGVVFVNGFNLGRFWEIGPQFRLYLPGPLLKQGENTIVIFETEGIVKDTITLTDVPPFERQ